MKTEGVETRRKGAAPRGTLWFYAPDTNARASGQPVSSQLAGVHAGFNDLLSFYTAECHEWTSFSDPPPSPGTSVSPGCWCAKTGTCPVFSQLWHRNATIYTTDLCMSRKMLVINALWCDTVSLSWYKSTETLVSAALTEPHLLHLLYIWNSLFPLSRTVTHYSIRWSFKMNSNCTFHQQSVIS